MLLNSDETIDAGFNYDPDFNDPAYIKLIRTLPNGKFVVLSTNANGNEVVRILNSNGSVDNSFNFNSTQFQFGNNSFLYKPGIFIYFKHLGFVVIFCFYFYPE